MKPFQPAIINTHKERAFGQAVQASNITERPQSAIIKPKKSTLVKQRPTSTTGLNTNNATKKPSDAKAD